MLATGQRVDRYVVEGKLGEGGMATVYRVRHETLGTTHALKTLAMVSGEMKARLLREGRVQAGLQHPHLVQVTDVLEVDGMPSLLMQFVSGPSLESWLLRYQPGPDEALALFRGICLGVAYAHDRGVIHRDLKPANVLLALEEERVTPKVADFGLAKELRKQGTMRTRAGPMGTPGYMAPEQLRDASTVDRRADLWSLGCVLYRLVCGVAPFAGDDLVEVFAQVAAGDHVPSRQLKPDLPESVHVVLERLIHVDPSARPASCADVLALLDDAQDTSGMTWLPGDSDGARVAKEIARESLDALPKLDRSSWGSGEPLARPVESPPRPPPVRSAPVAPRVSPDPAPRGAPEASLEAVTRRPSSGLWVVLGLGAALTLAAAMVGLGAVGMVAIVGVSRPVRPTVDAPSELAQPAGPQPVTWDPPVPVDPQPVPSRGRTEPRPRSDASEPPAPATGPARVTFSGADQLWLTSLRDGSRVPDLTTVLPGRYRIHAMFPGMEQESGAGELTLGGGEHLHLNCVVEMAQCRAAR